MAVPTLHTGDMITIQETVTSARPRPDVFAYVADFARVAEWDPGIASARRVAGDGAVGSRYEVQAGFAGRVVPMTYEVVEHTPPARVVLRGTAATLEAVDDIRFEETEAGGTRVVYRAEFTLKGPLRLFALPLRPVFARLGRRAISGLDRALNS
jgi:carbon monoxide dehydrogenase subunit G